MNNDSPKKPGENDDKKSSEELKDAILKSHEIVPTVDEGPVGPFEHSGEAAGWTATEEKQEKLREDKQ